MSSKENVVRLDWDSDLFGYDVGRLGPDVLGDAELSSILQQVKGAGYALIYWSVPANGESAAAALRCGGLLIDNRVTYVKKLADVAATRGAGDEVASYPNQAPEPSLVALALESGAYSRFRLDRRLKGRFEQLYTTWITRSVRREIAWEVLVVREGADTIGMVTLGRKGERGDIGLVAVAPAARQRGLGRLLLGAAESAFCAHGYREVQVVTQLANAAGCKLYESCGYEKQQTESVFHFWLDGVEARGP